VKVELSDHDGALRARVSGPIDADADFGALLGAPRGELRLDLSGITMFTSPGVRRWLRFVTEVPASVAVRLERCPPLFINQVSMISNLLGHARIETLFVPFLCPACEANQQILVAARDVASSALPEVTCEACRATMELDVAEEQYFSFLEE
jgi:hypothetical protein